MRARMHRAGRIASTGATPLRKIPFALVAALLAGIGAFAPAAAPAAFAAANPKVAIIVGAVHGLTANYRSYADQVYAEATRYTDNVVRVYSPNATWTNVKAAVNGASIVVYMGHGNGWPSPYAYDAKYTTKDGFGLNYDVNGDGKLSDYELKYYGEPSIATLTPAPNAVVLLFHLCYAGGSSEPGLAEPTLDVARQRVDNYASAFLKAGARAVIADGHSHAGYISRLFTTRQTVDQLWRTMPDANGHLMSYPSVRSPGYTYQLDPDTTAGDYYRAMTGLPSLTTADVTGATYAATDTDPATFQAPGSASTAVDNVPVYATADDAAAGGAIDGSTTDTAAQPVSPAPIATLPLGARLRVSAVAAAPDGAELLDIQSLDGATTGWIAGGDATPRDSVSPAVWSVSDGNALFTPNGDGDRDVYRLSVALSESTTWTLAIEDASGSTLETRSGTGRTAATGWDGFAGGALAPDGTYRWHLTASDGWGNPPLKATSTFRLVRNPTPVSRLAGSTRFDTSAAISAASFAPGVPVVFITNGFSFPDALTAAPVAGKLGAPLLLVSQTSVPPVIAAELARLKPGRIVVLGGPGMVSDATMRSLGAYTGGTVSRLAGITRFDTSAAISAASFAPGVPVVFITNGFSFPDALTAAPVAGKLGAPLLLVSQTSVPPVIAAELARLRPGRIVVLGGPGMVSDATLRSLGAYTGGTVSRLAGSTRFDTSAAISAASFAPGVPVVFITNGFSFPDALTAAPVAGKLGAPLLLVSQTSVPPVIAAELARLRPGRIVVLGGPGMVSDATLRSLGLQ